jgi:hypothetical protein
MGSTNSWKLITKFNYNSCWKDSILGIKGVHYIGSIQPLLGIWKNNKKAENRPNCWKDSYNPVVVAGHVDRYNKYLELLSNK